MARLLVADDLGVPWVEIVTDPLGGHTTICRPCQWRSTARPFDPITDHLRDARIHVDYSHTNNR